jgi:hypothetical protein
MRLVYCFCGHCIEGTTDSDLFQRNRHHQEHAHPTDQTSDTQIWAVIKSNTHEKQDAQDHEQPSTESHTSGG